LAVRFPDVTEIQIRQIFWTKICGYLQLHLIGKGLNPECSSIKRWVKYASRHEATRKTLKREKVGTCGTYSNVEYSTRATGDSFENHGKDGNKNESGMT
jgi:hypothetical protein